MKNKIIKQGSIFLFLFLFLIPAISFADEFSSFMSRGVLGRDGSLSVTEHFIFDFGEVGKHGIIREIPLLLDKEDSGRLSFTGGAVLNKEGLPYVNEVSSGGNVARVRIGDPKILLTGKHYYDVQYSIQGAASKNVLNWDIVSPMKENIAKLQSDLFFPLPLPPLVATATCSFMANKGSGLCRVEPLLKDKLLYGYRVSASGITKETIRLTVSYPLGLIDPPLVIKEEKSSNIPKSAMVILGLALLLAICVYVYNKAKPSINAWRTERKKPVLLPDSYSYLARAVAAGSEISAGDIVATLADLTARGYVRLDPIAFPVGELEFIDYAIELTDVDFPVGSEGEFLSIIQERGGIPSLDAWLRDEYEAHEPRIRTAASVEVDGIILLTSDEEKPGLPGFRFEK